VRTTLPRTVADAACTPDGAVYASASLVLQRRQAGTPVYSDERALWADRLPYELGRGPCLDAVRDQEHCQAIVIAFVPVHCGPVGRLTCRFRRRQT
jgi:hypothetical protein